jgi:hypothetical protein
MLSALNFTAKAAEQLRGYVPRALPGTGIGLTYLAQKLRRAEIFVLPDCGELLDRSKVRPEMPPEVLHPPFPVVALEYHARNGRHGDQWTASICSKRIALAWEWSNDFPIVFPSMTKLGPGVVVASIPFYDEQRAWLPVCAAMHIAYDATWLAPTEYSPSEFRDAMIAAGSMSRAQAKAKSLPITPIPILPEACTELIKTLGDYGALEVMRADVNDEINAYTDLCFALACHNVTAERTSTPARVNAAREKAGKSPLADFHVLKLGGEEIRAPVGSGAIGGGRRGHLRRGHIRRLSPTRMTWVNATIVRGRAPGFVDKVYQVGAAK